MSITHDLYPQPQCPHSTSVSSAFAVDSRASTCPETIPFTFCVPMCPAQDVIVRINIRWSVITVLMVLFPSSAPPTQTSAAFDIERSLSHAYQHSLFFAWLSLEPIHLVSIHCGLTEFESRVHIPYPFTHNTPTTQAHSRPPFVTVELTAKQLLAIRYLQTQHRPSNV